MPDPTEYQVVRSLQTALLAIAVASGYHYDVAALAVKLDANSDVESLVGDSPLRPFYVLEVLPDSFTYKPANRVDVVLPIAIHAIHGSDPTVDEDWWRTYFRLCADAEQALTQDLRRGGLATDTRILSRQAQTFNGSQVWAVLSGEVQIPRIYGAPNG